MKFVFIILHIAVSVLVKFCVGQQKAPYHGKYCGTLQEIQSTGKFRYYNCYGVVWAMGAARLKMTGFTFQQSLFLPENITFWIGPAVKTGNDLLDMVPSQSGYYLEPKTVPPQLVSWEPSPILIAKKPSVQEVSSILRQGNTNVVVESSSSTTSSLKSQNITPVPEPVPSTSTDSIRLPREAAFPERQHVPVAEPSKKLASLDATLVPEPEPTKTSSATTATSLPTPDATTNVLNVLNVKPILVQNLTSYTGTKIIAQIPNFQTNLVQSNNPIVVKDLDLDSSGNKIVANFPSISNKRLNFNETSSPLHNRQIVVVADAADSVQKITKVLEEHAYVSTLDKTDFANKFVNNNNIYSDPFNSNKSQLLDSTKKVAIILLLGTGNTTTTSATTLDGNLPSHGTTISLKPDQGFVSSDAQSSATVTSTYSTTASTITSTHIERTWKPLSWFSGNDDLYLDLPQGTRMSDFRWLSVYDHTNQLPVATLLLPNGRGFFVPAPLTLKGFRPTLRTKDVHSGPIEILDTKTIRINDFYFEGDAPGAWFTVGTSLFPTLSGHMVPILKEDGKFDCDFLKAYKNQTVILKLPGAIEASDAFWLSVFCVPYAISFAHVYLPYKDLSVPISESIQPIPICMLEGSV